MNGFRSVGLAVACLLWAAAAGAQVMCGDLDANGVVDAADATILRRHLAGAQTMSVAQAARCNVLDESRAYEIVSPACSLADAAVMARAGAGQPPAPLPLCEQQLAIANPVSVENANPGSSPAEWELASYGASTAPFITGFTDEPSVNKGEALHFRVGVDSASAGVDYQIRIYRLGWYGGAGARLVHTSPVLTSATQPDCIETPTPSLSSGFDDLLYPGPDGPGLISCLNWAPSYTWSTPTSLVSGVFAAKLSRTDAPGASSRVLFVVRDDARHSAVVVQVSDTTWQAYNAAPLSSVSGFPFVEGHSLYDTSAARAYKVSYLRPHRQRVGTLVEDSQDTLFFAYEYPLIRFLETQGFDVEYSTGVDSDMRGNLIRNHRVFVSNGHDEYWSAAQRAQVEAARDVGVNLMFVSGNTAYWKVRWEDAFKTLVCFKEPAFAGFGPKLDPLPGVTTSLFRDPLFGPPLDGYNPENALVGLLTSVGGSVRAALTVTSEDAQLRFWRGTPVAATPAGATTAIGANGVALLGFEIDGDVDNGARPAGLFRVSTSLVDSSTGADQPASTFERGWSSVSHGMSLYRAPSGALVFAAGTIQLPFGLSYYNGCATRCPSANGEDASLRQAMVNLLADMSVQPTTLQPDLQLATASTDTVPPTAVILSPSNGASLRSGETVVVSGLASDTGGRIAAVEVSTDDALSWHPADGRAAWSYRFTPCAATTSLLRARAIDDSGNVGSPSTGKTFTVNPAGASNYLRNGRFDCGFDVLPLGAARNFNGGSAQIGSGWFVISNSGTLVRVDDGGSIAGVHLQRVWGFGPNDGVGQNLTLEVGRSHTLRANVFVEACEPGVSVPCGVRRVRLAVGPQGGASAASVLTEYTNRWEPLEITWAPATSAATIAAYSDLPNTVFKLDNVTLTPN